MKTKTTILTLLITAIQACSTNSDKVTDESMIVKETKAESTQVETSSENNGLIFTKRQLIGVWTDGTTENATFRIDADSLLNVEHLESYAWELKQDTLVIYYPEETYKGKITNLTKDAFTLQDEYTSATFERFEN
jgi:hypothetical protein